MELARTQEEIDRLENWAAEGQDNGTHYFGMSYEDGIRNTIDWLLGRSDTSPADD
jgi:hypothetical protein